MLMLILLKLLSASGTRWCPLVVFVLCFEICDMCIVNYKIYKPNIIGVMFAALAHDLGLKILYHAMVGVVSAPMIARMDL